MKFMTLIAFLIMSVAMVSCGGDDDKSSSNRGFSTSKLSTMNGYLNLQNNNLELGGQVYPPNQAYANVINQGLMQARMKNPPVQPVMHNGVQKYRVKVTAQLMNYNQGYAQPYSNTYSQQGGYNQGYNNTNYTQGTLNISNVVFY